MHAHTLTYVYLHKCMYRYTHEHIHACIHTYSHMCTYTDVCTGMHINAHTINKGKWNHDLRPSCGNGGLSYSHFSWFTVDAPSLSISIVLLFAVLLSCGDFMEREWVLRVASSTPAAYLLHDLKEFTSYLWAFISLFVDLGCNACRVSGLCNAMR